MEFAPTSIAGAFAVRHDVRADARGRFKRQYCERAFAAAGLATHWVQVNHSVTLGRGTIRGLHFQRPPHAEAKLVSCPVGRAFDVVVDLRSGSATFLNWAAVEIDETTSCYLPPGCAHGFQALTDAVHLIYQHSADYAPDAEGGVRFNDPALGIAWPLPPATMSDRDQSFALITRDFEGLTL
ncbi:MAG TPA: dTDP-4-dehydrorhamnose 3,5-epimerase family protein [Sphingomicrobium sp.]|jgi:dTDP-4-dehydrorhamnose 3,5-epimerase|nr:dTDP-4-dehydrorhamnose 3,5-epimerase family protein [Sphingomicrobium sp.]